MLEVRVARPNEFDAVLAFYTTMIDEMQGTDFDVQWQHDVHPSPTFLRESLEAGQVIVGLLPAEGVEVVSEGSESEPIIASAMVVNHEGAPGYDAVPWNCGRAARAGRCPACGSHAAGLPRPGLRSPAREGCRRYRPCPGSGGSAPRHLPPQRARPRPLRVLRFRRPRRVARPLPGTRRHPGRHVRARTVAFAKGISGGCVRASCRFSRDRNDRKNDRKATETTAKRPQRPKRRLARDPNSCRIMAGK